jgi:hypothetical protein
MESRQIASARVGFAEPLDLCGDFSRSPPAQETVNAGCRCRFVEPDKSAHGVRSIGLWAVLAPDARQQSNTDQRLRNDICWSVFDC